jgi:hypothetical protein
MVLNRNLCFTRGRERSDTRSQRLQFLEDTGAPSFVLGGHRADALQRLLIETPQFVFLGSQHVGCSPKP